MTVAARRVLVVDDHVDAAESLSLFLKLEGYDVRKAHNGRDALRDIAEFSPDVVMLDIELGDMSGLEVARELRARRDDHQPYLVALTGHDEDRLQPGLAIAGFDQFLRKPFGVDELRRILTDATTLAADAASSPTCGTDAPKK